MSEVIKKLLQIDRILKPEVLKEFGVTEDDLNKYVVVLEEWLKQNRHLPNENCKTFLENLLMHRKFNIEETKVSLDFFYSSRHLYPSIFNIDTSVIELIDNVFSSINYFFLPVQKPNKARITLLTFKENGEKSFNMTEFCQFIFLTGELFFMNDTFRCNTSIIDMQHFNNGYLSKLSPIMMINYIGFLSKIIKVRIDCIHYVHSSKLTDIVVNIMKTVLPGKLVGRFHVHNDIKTLTDDIPKSCLPSDYGGDLKSVKEFSEEWKYEMKKLAPYFQQRLKIRSNESLRPPESSVHEICGLGSEGSFRKLEVD